MKKQVEPVSKPPAASAGRFDYLNFAKENEDDSPKDDGDDDKIREKESDDYEDDFEESSAKDKKSKDARQPFSLPND